MMMSHLYTLGCVARFGPVGFEVADTFLSPWVATLFKGHNPLPSTLCFEGYGQLTSPNVNDTAVVEEARIACNVRG